MSEFFIEIYCEEVPANMQSKALQLFSEKAAHICLRNNIILENFKSFISPTRLLLQAQNVSSTNEQNEKKGPSIVADKNIVLNFARVNNTTIDKLIVKNTAKGDCYFHIAEKEDIETILKKSFEELLINFTWPKSMKWDVSIPSWVRPIRAIICIYDEKILPISFGTLTAGNITYGHKLLTDKKLLTIQNFADYQIKMKENFIYFNQDERKNFIVKEVEAICIKHNLKTDKNQRLIDEITGLVDYPVAIVTEFDQSFLSLPKEVLVTVMVNHQRYIPLYDYQNKLSNKFIIFANNLENQLIIDGNKKVITARFKDGEFFYQQDIKIGIDAFVNKLKDIIFHRNLHSMYEKTQNVTELSLYIADIIGYDLDKTRKAAHLLKADLATNMVKEFPELQGIMGYYYALDAGYNEEIAIAIGEHYLPSEENLQAFPLLFIMSLADRIDSLVSLFYAGERPTGSKDPYALRRLAISIIKLALHEKYSISLRKVLSMSANSYSNEILTEVENYLIQRIYQLFPEINKFYINYYINESLESDFNLRNITRKAGELHDLMQTSEAIETIGLYKRINNILNDEQCKNNNLVDTKLLNLPIEQKLYQTIALIEEQLKITDNLFDKITILLSKNILVKEFFDNVLINTDDKEIKQNRINILRNLKAIFNAIINFENLTKEV